MKERDSSLVDQHCANGCSINRTPPIVVAIRNSFRGELYCL